MLHLVTWMALAAYAQDTQPTPKSYDLYRTPTPINIDGKLNDPAWKKSHGPLTSSISRISETSAALPHTRLVPGNAADDQYLYIAAELQERSERPP